MENLLRFLVLEALSTAPLHSDCEFVIDWKNRDVTRGATVYYFVFLVVVVVVVVCNRDMM